MIRVLFLLLLSVQVFAVVNPAATGTYNFKSCGGSVVVHTSQSCPAASAGDPFIAFSDLISAPKTGWSAALPNQGAVVTIWGRNFGSTRGSSYVTVNGVNLTSAGDYFDDWAKTSNPTPFLQSITFQLNSTMTNGDGTISVTVDGDTSNTIPFRINTIGTIYFTQLGHGGTNAGTYENPFTNPSNEFRGVMGPGDIQYLRAGTYDQEYNSGSPKHVIWVDEGDVPGTAADPIAWVGYPGEDAFLDGVTNGDTSNFNKGWETDQAYHTISKLRISGVTRGVAGNDYTRIIGNDIIGNTAHANGAGNVHSGGDGNKILGNSIHGARTAHKQDHAIYIDGCQDVTPSEIGYNYVYDNFVGEGPIMSENHQESSTERCPDNVYMKSNQWHSNVVDCSFRGVVSIGIGDVTPYDATAADAESRGFYIYDLSWDPGQGETEPDPTLVYNNITYQCGIGTSGAFQHGNGHAKFYNNIAWDSKGPCLALAEGQSGAPIISTQWINNVCHMADGETVDPVHEILSSPSGTRTYENNSYYNSNGAPTGSTGTVTADPKVTVDVTDYDPVIVASDSPLIDVGSSTVNSIVNFDFFGTARPQNSLYDIGVVEQ